MRQHNGARVLSSDVSSGPDLRPPSPVEPGADGRPRPRNAATGKRDDRNTSKLPLRASALARYTEAQMSLFLLDEACIVGAIWA